VQTLNQLVASARKHGSFAFHDSELLEECGEWLVGPVGHHRDSDLREESNWECTLREFAKLDPEGTDYREIRFGHWGVGWIEELLVRPGTAVAKCARDIQAALADYPILDDCDHSTREMDSVMDNLPSILHDVRSEVVRAMKAHAEFRSGWDYALDDFEDDALYELLREHGIDGEIDDGWIRYSKSDIRELADLVTVPLAIVSAFEVIRTQSVEVPS
jgi:hypothetical protein